MEAAWAVVAAVSARAEKCVSPFSHYKPTADLTPFLTPFFHLTRNGHKCLIPKRCRARRLFLGLCVGM